MQIQVRRLTTQGQVPVAECKSRAELRGFLLGQGFERSQIHQFVHDKRKAGTTYLKAPNMDSFMFISTGANA